MLSHLRIISIFNVSKVNEPGTNIGDTTDKKTDYHNIIYNLLGFSSYHNHLYFKQ
ncbi:hypothetical protein BN891_28600 [Bacteroides xylanisolvens SD CC 2a]|nr:hypothetical protein BN891_28600 [Bacteroides xylanisolvens SD CC 2a]